jgi:adenylate kinase
VQGAETQGAAGLIEQSELAAPLVEGSPHPNPDIQRSREGMRLILIGPPGVGKGTQAALLESRLGIKPLSSGVIFRAEIEAQTDLGRLAQRYIEHGELVPNGVTIEMMAKRLRRDDVRKQGFVLDGFPRTLRQAQALDEILSEMALRLDKVVSIEVPDEVVIGRLSGRIGCTKCGEIYHSQSKPPKREGLCDKCNGPLFVRSDDQPGTIRERLRVFHETTAPVCEYYTGKGMLQQIDGSLDPESVYQQIVSDGQQ